VIAKHPPRAKLQASRWTPAGAVGVFLAFLALLQERFRFVPPWARAATVAFIVLVAVTSTLPRARPGTKAAANVATVALVALLSVMLVGAIGSLIVQIYEEGVTVSGVSVLSTTVILWTANVIVFALWYWLIDRGGPDRRAGGRSGPVDLLFPQCAAPELFPGDWTPRFVDYLFVAFVTSTAFSPADTLPVTPRAKLIMLVQALLSLATVIMLVGRAINILK
jgi:uncharacterized membrane protein